MRESKVKKYITGFFQSRLSSQLRDSGCGVDPVMHNGLRIPAPDHHNLAVGWNDADEA